MEWLPQIKVIIFDMDGTLYQEDGFMNRYIRYLLEGTEWEQEADASIESARMILSGLHPVKLGHFYHKIDDVGLAHHAGRFVEDRYESLSLEDPCLLYMGDPWGIIAAIRHKYKIPEQKLAAAFVRIREEMIAQPYQFEFREELFRAIELLDTVDKKILMTNTYEKSGIDFLQYMQILHLFDEIYCGAEKPFGLQEYLGKLLETGYQPHQILSIGDNPWNDLYPVKRMGGRTCFISPYPSGDTEQWDLRLHSLDELKQLMLAIQHAKEMIVWRKSN